MAGQYHFPNIIGRSDAIKTVFALMAQAIDSDSDVLITGEMGTGKKLVAGAIHENSSRKDKRLFVNNGGAVPKEVLVSELFGHCKDAFEGAADDKVGLFEAAEGSTLTLDEIGDMPLDVQPSLLRVLEEREVIRLGETTSRAVDVRVIAITNANLPELVDAGSFLKDLYNRLKVFEIHLPVLRERAEDIPLLAEHFYNQVCQQLSKVLAGFSPEVMERLSCYHWPSNVRELRNAIRRACALTRKGERIQIIHLPPQIRH